MLSTNQKEMMQNFSLTFLEMYKIVIASLLSLFVPQFCEETNSTCTLSQNFENLSRFNEFVIAFNFITLGYFTYFYVIQSRRETYFITHLEVNDNLPENGVQESLKNYPTILKRVEEHNHKLQRVTRNTLILSISNVIFSAFLIFYYFYDGFRSVTTLVTSVLLVSQKLYSTRLIVNDCMYNEDKKPRALSVTRTDPIAYNDIDNNYAKKEIELVQPTTPTSVVVVEDKQN
jgi:hypothetical protein